MTLIPRCDLKASSPILRANDWGHPYRLTEAPPAYDRTPASLHAIFSWFGVERGGRWRPKPGTTYCNVYATDVAQACGVYLPRVWWSDSSLKKIEKGELVTPTYGSTVVELSANALFRWLSGPHSESFGWYRLNELATAQNLANEGYPVVICCRKKVESSPGHIAVVGPESDTVKAVKDAADFTLLPVLSQAGAKNEELGVAGHPPWWTSDGMAEWGAWYNDLSTGR